MSTDENPIIDRTKIDKIIHESDICHISCCLEERPYLIPISFGYDGEAVYIHTGKQGKKITIFEENPQVCLSFVSQAEIVPDPEEACDWAYEFSSVISDGAISEIPDLEGKAYGLNQIMSHYSGKDWNFPEKTLKATRVWKIPLEDPTGRISTEEP